MNLVSSKKILFTNTFKHRLPVFFNKMIVPMRKEIIVIVFVILTFSLSAQVKFDLGVKCGVNFSKLSFDLTDYNAEAVTKIHLGAFGRIGWNRFFLQPEFYFSGKGGSIDSNLGDAITYIDFNTFDIPLLLGLRAIKGKIFDLQFVAVPVFSNITSKELGANEVFNPSFFNKQYFGLQYGIGVDVLFMTLHARMENGLTETYSNPDPNKLSGKNNTFMVSLGFRFL